MALFEDFKKFAFKGNVVDLAVGVIIGAAFQKIVSALVADLIMPLVSLILKAAANPKDNVAIKYGDFAGNVLDFLIVAFVLFLIVSRILKAAEVRFVKKDEKPVEPTVKECPYCFETIPAKATKCKACTSVVPEKPVAVGEKVAPAS
jgi:large conductance mechanosensitive channel